MAATPSTSFANSARRTISMEATAVADLESRIGEDFNRACELLLACQGRIIVTGMGKSGHIARKIAATLASTGTPAFFINGHFVSGAQPLEVFQQLIDSLLEENK